MSKDKFSISEEIIAAGVGILGAYRAGSDDPRETVTRIVKACVAAAVARGLCTTCHGTGIAENPFTIDGATFHPGSLCFCTHGRNA